MSSSGMARQRKEKRLAASIVGFCIVTVLVVLFVMSNMITSTYTSLLKTERGKSMQSVAVACATALSDTEISEGMTYPLPVYEYDTGKAYIFDIYTKAGNSFFRLYSSSTDSENEYTLEGAGDEYNDVFENQSVVLTTRTENDVSYVCAVAPIISSENTVAGVLEVRMTEADFGSTVNGMSLSWVFTIFAIAISVGILIFEFNLLISTIHKGVIPNTPVLIMYGENANRFLSFFMAFAVIMQPISIMANIRDYYSDGENNGVMLLMLILNAVLYIIGFFGFTSLRKMLKVRFTSRIALISLGVIGYFFMVLAGVIGNVYFTTFIVLPVAFMSGEALDVLRDYRLNAGKLGYAGFSDKKIHEVQVNSILLGSVVGAVLSGICYERFGLLVVLIISGAAMILTNIGISFFMRRNDNIMEAKLPLNKWMMVLSDSMTGKILLSGYFIIGIVISFLVAFMPGFLGDVGISLATTSFYYLITAISSFAASNVAKIYGETALPSKSRVMISSISVVAGLILFAVSPTAKMLVFTCILFGISLGIHDFEYIKYLAVLSKNRIQANLRKAAELTMAFGIFIGTVFFTLAGSFGTTVMKIALLAFTFIVFIISFAYPVSKAGSFVDSKLGSLKQKSKPSQPKKPAAKRTPEITMPPETYEEPPMTDSQQAPMENPYQEPYQDPYQAPYNNQDGGSYNG